MTFSFRIFWRTEFMIPSSTANHPVPDAGKQPQAVTLPPDCWCDVLFMKWCVSFVPDQEEHKPSKKLHFCLISPLNMFPKVFLIKMCFGKCLYVFWGLFGQQAFTPWKSPCFAQSVFYCWILNCDLNWDKWGPEFFRWCSGFFCNFLDDLLMPSWSNFGRLATPMKFHKFSLFVDNGYHCGVLESQSRRTDFVTLIRLIDVTDYQLFP